VLPGTGMALIVPEDVFIHFSDALIKYQRLGTYKKKKRLESLLPFPMWGTGNISLFFSAPPPPCLYFILFY
jgi:hypothetical protein